ncbi:Cof-type HAD-IIB family hydrolase [Ruminococcus sp. FC2018]|uniref:Cof-type HAD-IIB family hydrolase n=1 Tax=Ruminococcus sp. FC2018 TaxID=1410617 RepID=UPI00048B0E1C|nr:Cof-type HAD-IIB family hydrolase [Ruminococcus sp. FC2018]
MKTLYVSDLDGTLLSSDQCTSDFTNSTINSLVSKGMLFSYATARSFNTSQKVTKGLTAKIPVIVYNGTLIKDSLTGELLIKNTFEKHQAEKLTYELIHNGIYPIIYSFSDGIESFSYIKENVSKAESDFLITRKGDPRDRPVKNLTELTAGEIYYFTCIDEPQRLEPVYKKYKDVYNCFYQSDIYSGEQWLEIIPKSASKANAVKQLKKLCDCDKTIVFGDGINDIDMFMIADEAYAVENADERLKENATGIIASNNDDGVARFLLEHF